MKGTHTPALGLLLGILGFLSACAPHTSIKDPFAAESSDPDSDSRPYRMHDRKPFVSGPYGNAVHIHDVVSIIKRHSPSSMQSVRGTGMPYTPKNGFLETYHMLFPTECGGGAFHFYQDDNTQILEYEYVGGLGEIIRIRDYIVASGPFAAPGLWGPFDHTSDSTGEMCILPGQEAQQGGPALLRVSYPVGWVTTMSDWRQVELGVAYEKALQGARLCADQPQLLAKTITGEAAAGGLRLHTVGPGETLSIIAKKYYRNAARWQEIYLRNQTRIGADPNTLKVGTDLEIP